MFGRIFSFLMSLLFLVLLGYLGYMVGDRNIPILTLDRTVETLRVPQGGQLLIRVKFITEKPCNIHTDRFLFDSQDIRHDLPPTDVQSGTAEIGKPEEYKVAIDIPVDFPPGTSIYRTLATFKCNAIQALWPLRSPVRDTQFEVTQIDQQALQQNMTRELRELLTTNLPSGE